MRKGVEGPCQPGRNGDGLAIEINRRFLNKEVDSHCKAQDEYTDYRLEWEKLAEGSFRNLEKRE